MNDERRRTMKDAIEVAKAKERQPDDIDVAHAIAAAQDASRETPKPPRIDTAVCAEQERRRQAAKRAERLKANVPRIDIDDPEVARRLLEEKRAFERRRLEEDRRL